MLSRLAEVRQFLLSIGRAPPKKRASFVDVDEEAEQAARSGGSNGTSAGPEVSH